MVLKIFLILVMIIASLITVLMVLPVHLTIASHAISGNTGAAVYLSIVHENFLRVAFFLESKQYEILFLNKFKRGTFSHDEEAQEIEIPASQSSFDAESEVFNSLSNDTSGAIEPQPVSREAEARPAEAAQFLSDDSSGSPSGHDDEAAAFHTPPIPPGRIQDESGTEPHRKQRSGESSPSSAEAKSEAGQPRPNSVLSTYRKFMQYIRFIIQQKKIAGRMLSWFRRVFRSVFRVISFKRFELSVSAGFEDPAIAGMIHGFSTALYHSLDMESNRRFKFMYEPRFEHEDIITAHGLVSVKTTPGMLIRPLAIAVLTFPYISAFILWRRIKKITGEKKGRSS